VFATLVVNLLCSPGDARRLLWSWPHPVLGARSCHVQGVTANAAFPALTAQRTARAEKEALLSMYGAAMASLEAQASGADRSGGGMMGDGMMGEDLPNKEPLQIGYHGCAPCQGCSSNYLGAACVNGDVVSALCLHRFVDVCSISSPKNRASRCCRACHSEDTYIAQYCLQAGGVAGCAEHWHCLGRPQLHRQQRRPH
jgi:hypothetical protein